MTGRNSECNNITARQILDGSETSLIADQSEEVVISLAWLNMENALLSY